VPGSVISKSKGLQLEAKAEAEMDERSRASPAQAGQCQARSCENASYRKLSENRIFHTFHPVSHKVAAGRVKRVLKIRQDYLRPCTQGASMEVVCATTDDGEASVVVPADQGLVGLLSEGAASGIVVLGAFCNEAHGLPARDLTVAALRAFADMEGCPPRSLVCVDALAGCGLRALRLALEVAHASSSPR
jgi:hypothetical protein